MGLLSNAGYNWKRAKNNTNAVLSISGINPIFNCMKKKPIKIVLTEDNALLAQSIQDKLKILSDDIQLVFRASNGRDLLEKLEINPHIDLILMDIEMPEMDGIAATQKVKQKYPEIKIIMLTVFDDDEKIFRSIQAGATGYLLKDETPEKVLEGIKHVMDGGATMSPSIAVKTLELLRKPSLSYDEESDEVELTDRQIEVLEQMSQGLSYKAIADNLFISPATVRKHIENIYDKLQVHNKVQAIQRAAQNRLI